MLRRWGPLFVLVVATLSVGGLMPRADARPVPDLATAWQAAGCDPRYPQTELNGKDSTVLHAWPWAGQRVTVQWKTHAFLPLGVAVDVIDKQCKTITTVTVDRPGAFFVQMPVNAEWIVFHHNGMVGCQFAWT